MAALEWLSGILSIYYGSRNPVNVGLARLACSILLIIVYSLTCQIKLHYFGLGT